MPASSKSAFNTWVLGYNVNKDSFPKPWCDAPDEIFSRARDLKTELTKATAASTAAAFRVGANIVRMKRELMCGRHTFMATDREVIVEYHGGSTTSGSPLHRIIAYDYTTAVIRAAAGTIGADESYEAYNPLRFGSSADGSGVPVLMAITLGELLSVAKTAGLEVVVYMNVVTDLAGCLARMMTCPDDEELEKKNGVAFATATHLIYSMLIGTDELSGLPLTLSPTGVFERMGEDDVATLRRDALPYTVQVRKSIARLAKEDREHYQSVLNAIQSGAVEDSYIFKGTYPDPKTVEAEEVEPNKTASAERIAKLRKELQLDIHPLTDEEKAMVPTVDEHYVIDDDLLAAAYDIKADWKYPGLDLAPNFILEGDAGSGKTAASKFWACVFGIPRTKMTMSPTFESSNLIGGFFPVFTDIEDWDITEDERCVLEQIRSSMYSDKESSNSSDIITALRRSFKEAGVRELIRNAYDIPTSDDICFDPEGSWAQLGYTNAAPCSEEITEAARVAFENKAFRLLNILCEQAESGNVSYRFILSELMRAFQNGWLVEIQEAASVLRPGVLTELNSLLEPNGRIELSNGKYIERHPDTIVVITTNRDYAGNVDLNESLRDRCMFGLKMDLPPASVMAERAMAQTGFDDRRTAIAAAEVIATINEEAKSKNIRGAFGIRSLVSWMMALRRGDFSEETFMCRVVFKMTTRDDDTQLLRDCFRANSDFASAVRAGRVRRA